MKLIFSNYDDISNPYYAGGGAVAIHDLAKRLAAKYEVIVINSKHPKKKQSGIVDGVYYKRIGSGVLGPQLDQLIFSLILPLYVLKEQYDIWIESFIPPFSGSINPLLARKPFIGLSFFLDGDSMQKKYKLPFAFFERYLVSKYKYIITTNTALEGKINQINNTIACEAIPIGINLISYQKTGKPTKTLLYVGRIDIYNKGLDILMKIAPSILEQFPEYKILIAGQGIHVDEVALQRYIHEKNLADKMILLGRVTNKEKIQLMNQCTIFLSPSRYETFGITILEALACGKPVVIFNIPGFSWVPDTCARKVTAFNAKQYKEAITDLLQSPVQALKVGKAAKEESGRYDWNEIIPQYETFIRSVINDFSGK